MAILLLIILFSWYTTELFMFILEKICPGAVRPGPPGTGCTRPGGLFYKPSSVLEASTAQRPVQGGASPLLAKWVSVVLALILIFYVYFFTSFVLSLEVPTTFAQGEDKPIIPDNTTPNNVPLNPFEIKVGSPLLADSLSFDVRNVTDVVMVTAIGKIALKGMSSVPTPGGKAIVGSTIMGGLGMLGAGYKIMNQARHNSPSSSQNSGSGSSQSEGNYPISSSLDELSSSECVTMALICVKFLIVIVLILFIYFVLIIWVLNKVNASRLNDNSPRVGFTPDLGVRGAPPRGFKHIFTIIGKDNNDWVLEKMLVFANKSSKAYLLVIGVFIILFEGPRGGPLPLGVDPAGLCFQCFLIGRYYLIFNTCKILIF